MTTKKSTTKNPAKKNTSPKKPGAPEKTPRAPRTPRAAKPVTAPPQDHETPSAKERANDANLAAFGAKGGRAAAGTGPRLSAINAAAKVLAEAPGPMSARVMIEQMEARALWRSPAGKTPAASLYAAITREIAKKGDESRFVKKGRGLFAARG